MIVNVKPWLLETHPMLESGEEAGAFVRSAHDARDDEERSSKGGSAKSWVWSSGFGAHAKGRYFDFSSEGGSEWWKKAVTTEILGNNLTGVW